MPHFDQYGGDEWICQVCGNIQDSKTKSEWRPDITGSKSAGNVCPSCLNKSQSENEYRRSQIRKVGIEQAAGSRKADREILNQLDYADNSAEYELQVELRSRGLENKPEPICCPKCKGDLEPNGGMVGEKVLVCEIHGIVWEDQEDAIRRVF